MQAGSQSAAVENALLPYAGEYDTGTLLREREKKKDHYVSLPEIISIIIARAICLAEKVFEIFLMTKLEKPIGQVKTISWNQRPGR